MEILIYPLHKWDIYMGHNCKDMIILKIYFYLKFKFNWCPIFLFAKSGNSMLGVG